MMHLSVKQVNLQCRILLPECMCVRASMCVLFCELCRVATGHASKTSCFGQHTAECFSLLRGDELLSGAIRFHETGEGN